MDDGPLQALRAMGVSEDQLREAEAAVARVKRDFPVYPSNRQAVELFLGLSAQWLYTPDGHRLGIDYRQMESLLNLRRVKRKHWPDIESRIGVMVRAALEII